MHWILSGRLKVERVQIAIANLSASLEKTKIVHLSDFHYDGLRLSKKLLLQAIEASNTEEPDLVLLTGDYITDVPKPIHKLVFHLKHLQSKAGIYACLGNHDILCCNAKEVVTQALTDGGIQVLWNATAYPLGEALPIVGLAEYWSREFDPKILEELPPDIPRLVLSHNPDTAAILQEWRVDLQLSGHSHGGQISIPGLGAVPTLVQPLISSLPRRKQYNLPLLKHFTRVMRHWQWAKGYHRVGTNQLYVNRGLGSYFPGRFFCPPELTVITLVRDNV